MAITIRVNIWPSWSGSKCDTVVMKLEVSTHHQPWHPGWTCKPALLLPGMGCAEWCLAPAGSFAVNTQQANILIIVYTEPPIPHSAHTHINIVPAEVTAQNQSSQHSCDDVVWCMLFIYFFHCTAQLMFITELLLFLKCSVWCVCVCVCVTWLFHRLKIGRFSGSLAELFLAPPHSGSVSGI